ncbi:MAG: hypothetical protein KBC66_05895 [Kiritimatiellae bacterium]|jgi:hypothetical protein|nr:hypothetical protein [Kiritimatiellia bacterium]NLD90893.1 hypothetical protein [Lentisphaerota bacterium]HOU21242.1 hypothetical protein [Kiritimatiellia bacterium]HPC18799.1 hypothetical protein [Kiritimatiellia bacterium]HQN81060.1 hypothetical protein [Kiritimatiellia bacterium]
MDEGSMTPREQLQYWYELAFFPPRLDEFWGQVKRGAIGREAAAEAIRGALLLHLALPESGYASVRALKRLAQYQASSKPFAPVTFLNNIARYLQVQVTPDVDHVPPGMVRDIGLPPFCRPMRSVASRVAESR